MSSRSLLALAVLLAMLAPPVDARACPHGCDGAEGHPPAASGHANKNGQGPEERAAAPPPRSSQPDRPNNGNADDARAEAPLDKLPERAEEVPAPPSKAAPPVKDVARPPEPTPAPIPADPEPVQPPEAELPDEVDVLPTPPALPAPPAPPAALPAPAVPDDTTLAAPPKAETSSAPSVPPPPPAAGTGQVRLMFDQVEPEGPASIMTPVAYIQIPHQVEVGDPVIVDASYSYSPIGDTVEQYRFRVDGGAWTPWQDQATYTFVASGVGVHHVAAQVQDTSGWLSTNAAVARLVVVDHDLVSTPDVVYVPAPSPLALMPMLLAGAFVARRRRLQVD